MFVLKQLKYLITFNSFHNIDLHTRQLLMPSNYGGETRLINRWSFTKLAIKMADYE